LSATGDAALPIAPDDVHNRALVASVRPPGWTNPPPAGRYHLVVVGAGTAGLVTAAAAAGLGARVALVERHLLGGDCLNVGCVPSKAVIRSARAVRELREAAALGVRAPGPPEVDFGAVMERVRRVRAELAPHDSAARFSGELGVDVFFGPARFTAPDAVAVDGQVLRFTRAVVATGGRPATPPIPGLAETGFLTNETVFALTARPGRLAVIGGGPIGCELAQAFRRLGVAVTVLEAGTQLLGQEDPDAAALVHGALARDGVRIVLGADVTRVAPGEGGKRLEYRAGGVDGAVLADEILVATGRAPNVEGLGLEVAGIRHTAAGIEVDDRLRTSNPRVYAAGDVCLPWRFTHAADEAARIVVQNALFGIAGVRRASRLVMPRCTYTDPEVAHVGLSEREARTRGIALDTFVQDLRRVDRAVIDGEREGFVKVHVRKGTGRLLGATIVARHAGDMIGELTLALAANVRLGALAGVIHPYPTRAAAIRQVADQFRRTRLTPRARKVLGAWLRWTR
jgi:pyruvate/2-oxoglutarate dehydrogenase complex dihydrolipoamide dehydrogenase (E3) component